MRNYWTCSKFADWLRGTTKGGAKTAEGWDEWEARAKANHPIRWWLAEEGLDMIQSVIVWIPEKLHGIKYYVNNRWVTKTHALTASPRDIKRGEWRDVGNRFLPCLFNELQDFVEVELAWWHLAWNEGDRHKYAAPWWAFGWFRIRTWRCPQAGLDNLEWQRNLRWKVEEVGEDSELVGQLTPQAVKAQEILDLYNWWTKVYRNRPDPMEVSGWSQHCEDLRVLHGDRWIGRDTKDPKVKKQGDKALKLLHKIEAQYEKEEEDMMIRLIKIRNGLWT